MTITAAQIRGAITDDAAIRALVPDSVAIAAALSAGRTRVQETMVSERRILALLGVADGDTFLKALEDFGLATLAANHPLAAVQSGIRRMVGWLKAPEGIDIGNPLAQQMLTVMGQLGILNVASVQTVLAFARVADPVSEMDVRRALWADNGTLLIEAL